MTSGAKHGRRRPLTDEERVLWTTVTRTIVPLGRPRTHHPQPEAVPSTVDPVPVKPATDQAPVARPMIRPSAPTPVPLDRRLKQRLARGSEPIDARVDLHGLTQAQAHDLLVRFVRTASSRAHASCS